MITLKINLLELKCSVVKMKSKTGEKECVVITIDMNNLFRGEKGIYLDMIAFDIKNKKNDSKDTHLIKQSFSKEYREMLSEEELKAIPILGNLAVLSGGITERDPVSNTSAIDEGDGLPF